VVRIDGMVKLMLEQHGIAYLPIESVSMQERVRAVEFVLARCGLSAVRAQPGDAPSASSRPLDPTVLPSRPIDPPTTRAQPIDPPVASRPPLAPRSGMPSASEMLKAGVEAWPHALAERRDHEA
jgi:hypothetical protein